MCINLMTEIYIMITCIYAFHYHTLLKPLATFNSQSQQVHLDTWNKEAFTIGGKKFDLKLTSASDGEYVSIAKKVQ